MNELQVKVTPAVIAGNFEDIKAFLTVEVEKYDVEVTAETVKDAKKLASHLNSVTKQINEVKKTQLQILEAPAKDFKSKIAELNGIVQDGRAKILDQVKTFEDETKAYIADLLKKFLEKELENNGIEEEFRSADYKDLILLGSLTGTGNLTSKAMDIIQLRVKADLSLQNEVKNRLLQLENESIKAGLKAPLQRYHVENFLKADQGEYETHLACLIKNEVQRQKIAEDRERENHERQIAKEREKAEKAEEAQRLAEARAEIAEEQAKTTPEQAIDDTPIPEAIEGRKTLRIDISFDISVKESAPEDKVIEKMKQILKDAGIPELNQIKIRG